MSPALLDAGLVALIASCLLLLGMSAFDRFAPAGLMRERHDLALTGLLVVPLVFVLALQPRPAVRDVDFLPTGVNETTTVVDAAPGQRVDDRIDVSRRRANRAGFPGAFDAERIAR